VRRRLIVLVAMVTLTACAGTLQSELDPGGDVRIGFSPSAASPMSTGFDVCTSGGAVRLLSVEPASTTGDIGFLGALLLTGTASPIGSAEGFPPQHVDGDLEVMEDAMVDIPCDRDDARIVSEVIIGVRRIGSSGGSIDGLTLTYDQAGHVKELDVPNFHVDICGAGGEHCED
jgi:hypothetical protein